MRREKARVFKAEGQVGEDVPGGDRDARRTQEDLDPGLDQEEKIEFPEVLREIRKAQAAVSE